MLRQRIFTLVAACLMTTMSPVVAVGEALTRTFGMARVIGGHPAVSGAYPWQVAMVNLDGSLHCGGTLIAPGWVLTAAHCLRLRDTNKLIEEKHPGSLLVLIGTNDLNIGGVQAQITAIHLHPAYDVDTLDNDIALLRISTASDARAYRDERPMRFDAARNFEQTGSVVTVIGWGKTESGRTSELLLEARLPIVGNEQCRAGNAAWSDRYVIGPRQICAGATGRDSCAGDSGGPLFARFPGRQEHVIIGIVSWGNPECGAEGSFGVYTRVSAFTGWIREIVGRE